MGLIYEEMDRAKERIQTAFNGVSRRLGGNYLPLVQFYNFIDFVWKLIQFFSILTYTPLCKIIGQRWDNQLHKLLHVLGFRALIPCCIIVLCLKLIMKLSMD